MCALINAKASRAMFCKSISVRKNPVQHNLIRLYLFKLPESDFGQCNFHIFKHGTILIKVFS